MRVRIVIAKREIVIAEPEKVGHRRIYLHRRQRAWRAAQLLADLVHVVDIDMGIAESVDDMLTVPLWQADPVEAQSSGQRSRTC